MNDSNNTKLLTDSENLSHTPEMAEFLAIEPPISQITKKSRRPDEHLLYMFNLVCQYPQWAGRLDPRFKWLDYCKIATEGDTPESTQLVNCINNCAATDDWTPLFFLLVNKNKNRERLSLESQDAWRTDFVGSSHQLLLARVVRIADDQEVGAYKNVLPILQSSDMGKSRTVDELAKIVFMIPICLHETPVGAVFPRGDKALVDALKLCSPYRDDTTPKYLSVILLTAIFEDITQVLQRYEGYEIASPRDWYEVLKMPSKSEGLSVRENTYNLAKDSVVKSYKTPKLSYACDKMKEALRILLRHLPSREVAQDSKLKLIVYVDECQSLTSMKLGNDSRNRTMLDCLLYAIDQCSGHGLVGIILSTNSILSHVSFPKDVVPSTREVEVGFNVRPAPFILSNYDMWRNQPIISGSKMTLFDVCKMSFLARFGRPLWWTKITNSRTSQIYPDIVKELCYFAAVKLVGADGATFGKEKTANAEFAILSVRLSLELEPSRVSSRRLEGILIANHMRVVYHVPPHKEYVRSGYSSEPVLAEAAASLWNNRLARFESFDPLASLTQVFEKCFLARGDRGELAARFILLRAQDNALSQLPYPYMIEQLMVDDTAPFSRPVPLWNFLKSLFNPERLQELSSMTARNRIGGVGLKKACERKYVRFTHFARAGDSSVLSTATGWKSFARAIAWQCYEHQPMVDIVIPVFMADNGYLLDQTAITFILIQVKNRKQPQTVHLSAEKLRLFNDIKGNRQIPYFVFIFNLGVVANNSSSPTIAGASPGIVEAHSKEMVLDENDPQEYDHPCYWLEAIGCSSNTFNSEIIPEGSNGLGPILATYSVLDEAEDEETKNTIKNLKAQFFAGSASFGWAQD